MSAGGPTKIEEATLALLLDGLPERHHHRVALAYNFGVLDALRNHSDDVIARSKESLERMGQ